MDPYNDGKMNEFEKAHGLGQHESFAKALLNPARAVGEFTTGGVEPKEETQPELLSAAKSSPVINGNRNGAYTNSPKKQGHPVKNRAHGKIS